MSETKTETKPAAAAAANKNEKIGQVVSNKMTKTIVVEVTRRVPHPLYPRTGIQQIKVLRLAFPFVRTILFRIDPGQMEKVGNALIRS